MMTVATEIAKQITEGEWVSFPGGELEGKRPKVLCPACRAAVNRAAAGEAVLPFRPRALCFECYRAEIERERALKAAGELDTASIERFQSALPFEPVNRPRLEMLKAEHHTARTARSASPVAKFVDRRRQAQIAARHALHRIATGLASYRATSADREREMAAAIHAAELQLPESWLPFVVSR
jgi:hypothetical protein